LRQGGWRPDIGAFHLNRSEAGDTIFSIGALTLAWFVLRLWVGPKRAAQLPADTVAAES
jgi:hypothetical protein